MPPKLQTVPLIDPKDVVELAQRSPELQAAAKKIAAEDAAESQRKIDRINELKRQDIEAIPARNERRKKAQQAIKDATKALRAAQAELRLITINSEGLNRNLEIDRLQAELMERPAFRQAVSRFKGELYDEWEALLKENPQSALPVVERHPVTGKATVVVDDDLPALRRRILDRVAAIREAYRSADELYLIADFRDLTAAFQKIRDSLPSIHPAAK